MFSLCGISCLSRRTALLITIIGVLPVSYAIPPTVEHVPIPASEIGIETRFCAFYNESRSHKQCSSENSTCPPSIVKQEECAPEESGKSNHCFVLWHTDKVTGESSVLLKGCFVDTISCHERTSRCTESTAKLELLTCCCEGDMCNLNMTFPGKSIRSKWNELNQTEYTEVPPVRVPASSPLPPSLVIEAPLAYSLPPLLVLFGTLIGGYLLYRRRKASSFAELPSGEASISRPPSPATGVMRIRDGEAPLTDEVTLCEVRARGRFGAVWRARLGQRDVAVKVFPLQDKQSWLAEQEIYRLPRMDHPDILYYIGVDKKGDNLQAEYWLITAYHEKGSLCDYLKAHTLSWTEAWRVAVSVARGLAHLHGEGSGAGSHGCGKPAVAHRDFKSKNVLLKADMSACIADFGLALVFVAGRGCGDAHGQVGTRRYMAPEVLDGAINFTKDAFLRIDMYAAALVLWEIASRCNECGSDAGGTYRLPLEEEVGSHPSLEEMQEAVVLRKLRPRIQRTWKDHPGLSVLCDTMEECWDHDAEARLSASCVLERVAALKPILIPTSFIPTSDMPLLIHDIANTCHPTR